MENKHWLKENWFKLGILLLALVAVATVVYRSFNEQAAVTPLPVTPPTVQNETSSSVAVASAPEKTAPPKVQPAPQDYYRTAYTVMCVGAINAFAQCKPIVADQQRFHIVPATGVVRITHPDLTIDASLVQNNCSIINGDNWSCTDASGNKTGFVDGEYFNSTQISQFADPNRNITALYVTKQQYLAASTLVKEQIQSQ